MNKTNCTIYDCEFDLYHSGIISQNTVWVLNEDGNLAPARQHICEYVDFDRVQFYIGEYDESGFGCSKDTCRWGYFALSTGKVVVPPIYDYAGPFYGDCACVLKNMKFGLVNPCGEIVVDIIWDSLGKTPFRDLYWVKNEFKFGYIDKNGVVILKPQFEKIEKFKFIGTGYNDYEYAALIKQGGKYGFINEELQYILEPKFSDAREFCEKGYALVMEDGKWWVISRKGQLITNLQFDEVREREIGEKGGYYTVKRNSQWGILDSEYKFIISDNGVHI